MSSPDREVCTGCVPAASPGGFSKSCALRPSRTDGSPRKAGYDGGAPPPGVTSGTSGMLSTNPRRGQLSLQNRRFGGATHLKKPQADACANARPPAQLVPIILMGRRGPKSVQFE